MSYPQYYREQVHPQRRCYEAQYPAEIRAYLTDNDGIERTRTGAEALAELQRQADVYEFEEE